MSNILIGCECSGAIRQRYRDAGHNAWSCDLKPAEDNSDHHKVMDVIDAIRQPEFFGVGSLWDLIILHPECTALTVAGNHVYAQGKPKHHERLAAIQWTERLWEAAKEYGYSVALENPQGVLATQSTIGNPQYIQPYEFGEDASKKTGFWLHNLPPLQKTKRIEGRIVAGRERWGNQTDSGQNKLGPSPTRAADRARTYPGIADAIVDQWCPTKLGMSA